MEFDYDLLPPETRKPSLGLIVLQSDETIESELRSYFPAEKFDLYVSRVESGLEVTAETLAEMKDKLTTSAQLFPRSVCFEVIGYGCTSGTSVIGPEAIHNLISNGCETKSVTEPVSGLLNACRRRNIKKLAFLSPYIEEVSSTLRTVLGNAGIQTPVFGSFNEAEEAKVARIDDASICGAARKLANNGSVDGLFMSCTNLKTMHLIDKLQSELGIPVLSSNFVLAEQMKEKALNSCIK